MSLTQMGEKTETVKFLEGFDFTFSLDSRSSASQQMMDLELSAKPVVVRASYRDISLITRIFNKAFERFGGLRGSGIKSVGPTETRSSQKATTLSKSARSKGQPIGEASVRMTKQQVCLPCSFPNCIRWLGSVQGLFWWIKAGLDRRHPRTTNATSEGQTFHCWCKRLVRWSMSSWVPIEHYSVTPLQLHAAVTMALQITFWNLMNSHWEPRKLHIQHFNCHADFTQQWLIRGHSLSRCVWLPLRQYTRCTRLTPT